MPVTDFGQLLRRIRATTLLLTTVSAGLCKYVFADKLIPEQLDWLSSAGILVCAISFLAPFAFKGIGSYARTLMILALVSLAGVIGIRASLVKQLNYYGTPHSYMVGWKMSEWGVQKMEKDKEKDGAPLSLETFLEDLGHADIPEAYGWTYYAACGAYVVALLGFLTSFILLSSALEAISV